MSPVLLRQEGLLLRYLSQVHKTLKHNIPDEFKYEEVLDIEARVSAGAPGWERASAGRSETPKKSTLGGCSTESGGSSVIFRCVESSLLGIQDPLGIRSAELLQATLKTWLPPLALRVGRSTWLHIIVGTSHPHKPSCQSPHPCRLGSLCPG